MVGIALKCWHDWLFTYEKLYSAISVVHEVLYVSAVVLVCSVDFVPLKAQGTELLADVLAASDGPSVDAALLTQSREEAVILTPDQVVMLLAHPQEVDGVSVADGHHDERAKVFKHGKSVSKYRVLKLIAAPRYCPLK